MISGFGQAENRATQAWVPSKISVHSARVRVANAAAIRSRRVGQARGSAARFPLAPGPAGHELGEELGLQRARGHPLAVGGLIDVVPRDPGVEEVDAALVPPLARGQHPVHQRGERGRAVDDGRVHHLAAAGPAGLEQRGQHAHDQVH
jgi:hypothetical protein